MKRGFVFETEYDPTEQEKATPHRVTLHSASGTIPSFIKFSNLLISKSSIALGVSGDSGKHGEHSFEKQS